MTCELDNIQLIRKQERKYEVNRHGERLGELTSGAEKFSHYECREHKQKFSEWPEVLMHLSDGKH